MKALTIAFVLSSILIFISSFAAHAQKAASDWNIAEYFKNLPQKYITAHGDYAERSAETAVVDEKNGYAAYLRAPPNDDADNPPFPIFEMALFKSRSKAALVVVSNLKSDAVCSEHETFFLRRVGSGWTEVGREVLPALPLKIFWDKPQSATRFTKIVERDNATTFHFEPPRSGTRMKVSLEICDYLAETAPMKSVAELEKLVATKKPIYLDWDKQNGRFIFAK